MREKAGFINTKIEQGRPIPDAIMDYEGKEKSEMMENEKNDLKKRSHFDRI
jgi:hypothetical protein